MRFAYEEEYARMVQKYSLKADSRVSWWRRLLKFLRLMS
jgi:hypothetical protein